VAKVADVVIVGGGIVRVSIAYCLGLKKPKGFRTILLELQDLLHILPELTVGDVSGTTFTPENGYLDPYLLTTALAKQAKDDGVEIEVDIEAKEVIVEKGRGMMANNGKIGAPIVINAAGPWGQESLRVWPAQRRP
jgi:glycine/D-amino acid oxidase-like deaminating enzyme